MNWLTKISKFVNDHSAICEICKTYLRPREITINKKHIYPIGQMFTCDCGTSRIWTNSIRNDDNLIAYFNGEPNTWGEVDYTNGFCNDKFCGYTFQYIQPLKNGVSVPWSNQRWDRYGNPKLPKNQHILMDIYSEDREGQTQNILEWYRQRQDQLEQIMEQLYGHVKTSQTKPMPLPFNRPSNSNKLNLEGLDAIDEQMSQNTADKEKVRDPKFLGSGYHGLAVKLNNNMVGKYSDFDDEVEIAEFFMHNPAPCVVKIHNVQQIQTNPDLWIIIMDMVKTLSKEEMSLSFSLMDSKHHKNRDEFYRRLARANPQLSDFVFKYKEMEKCLEETGLVESDLFGGNIGYNQHGDLVIFDLGGSSF